MKIVCGVNVFAVNASAKKIVFLCGKCEYPVFVVSANTIVLYSHLLQKKNETTYNIHNGVGVPGGVTILAPLPAHARCTHVTCNAEAQDALGTNLVAPLSNRVQRCSL